MSKNHRSSRGRAAGAPQGKAAKGSAASTFTSLDVRMFLLTVCVAALGYVALPSAGIETIMIMVFRGTVAGCVAGLLLFRPNPVWSAPAAAISGGLLGAAYVAIVTPAGEPGLSASAAVLGLCVGGGMALLLSSMTSSRLKIAAEWLAVAVIILMALWYAGVLPGEIRTAGYEGRQAQLSVPPVPEAYAFDGASFLRTYYLMKSGSGYYDAFQQGVIEDSRHDENYLTSPFNYREPLVFYLWRILPGASGSAVWHWFVVYSVVVMICAYVLASSLVARGAALLAPAVLVSFFFYFYWVNTWFTITEMWASGFGVAAVMCLVRRWRIPSLVLLALAVASREFMVLLIPAWLLVWWFTGHRKDTVWFPLAAVLGPALVLGAHLLAVPPTVTGVTTFSHWLDGGPPRLISALRFGFDALPTGKWLSLLIATAAIGSAALALPKWRAWALLAATILPTLFLLFISAGEWHYYWGAFYTPLAVAIAPGVFGRLLPPAGAGEVAGEA